MKLIKELEISMGHRLPNHQGGCSNLHGHNYRIIITISFKSIENYINNKQGFFIDFGDIKKIINKFYDHTFLLFKEDYETFFNSSKPKVMYNIRVVDYIPTAENISIEMANILSEEIKKNFNKPFSINIRLSETSKSLISYTKHYGR